jgi:hypothetical protein
MKESDFGRQYFSVFGAVKDSVSNNILQTCIQERISEESSKKILAAATLSIEQIATNAYPSLWGTVKNFFRE